MIRNLLYLNNNRVILRNYCMSRINLHRALLVYSFAMPEKQPTILSFISPFGTNFWKFKCLYGDSVGQFLRILYGGISWVSDGDRNIPKSFKNNLYDFFFKWGVDKKNNIEEFTNLFIIFQISCFRWLTFWKIIFF